MGRFFLSNPMQSSWVEIDLNGLRRNIDALRSALPPTTELMFVVKADAYGHGLKTMARTAADYNVNWFAVAHVHEAVTVRQACPSARILLMGVADAGDVPVLLQQRITPILVGARHGACLAAEARKLKGCLQGHLKVDTGMGRLGVAWDQAVDAFQQLTHMEGLEIEGVCSHFAAVEPQKPEAAENQVRLFRDVARAMEAYLGRPLIKHISSSRAMLYRPDWDFDMVRPGICLYGYGAGQAGMRCVTHPFLQWKANVMQVRDVPEGFAVGYYSTYVTPEPTRMAVLSVGYADGYHRALSNRGHVLIHGHRCPVIGRVSMNWVAVDAGAAPGVKEGDEVVLIGTQGETSVWAGELARLCRTIPYEILVGIDRMAPRRYLNDATTSPL